MKAKLKKIVIAIVLFPWFSLALLWKLLDAAIHSLFGVCTGVH